MKKIFTFALITFVTIVARATDYNEPIVVTVNGVTSEQPGVLSVVENGDAYDMTMKNFMLAGEDGPIGVGNVTMTGIVPINLGDVSIIRISQTVTITPGDDPDISFWMADYLPPVPVNMIGKIENGHLRCYIHIDMMESIQQIIDVTIGKGYQLPNQSFENWHTSTTNYVEPNGWHSFESGTGGLISWAGHHIKASEDAHSGSLSALVASSLVFGNLANGTMTTGRLNAGNMSAANVANHAYADMSSTDVDGNGDPFYTPMYSCPDSLVLWVKFKQGTSQADYPYATVSAVITDGSYYQDPEDKEYTNVVAKAKNNTIVQTNGEWVRMSMPFEYTDNDVEPAVILITASTNATPGKGSDGDQLLVDDIEFIYNCKLTSLKVNGESVPDFDSYIYDYEIEVEEEVTSENVEVFADGKTALVRTLIEDKENGQEITITVYSGDMSQSSTYVVKANKATAITDVTNHQKPIGAIYNLSGQRVMTPTRGFYIAGGVKFYVK